MSMDYAAALEERLAQQSEVLKRYRLDDGTWVWIRRINDGNPRFYYTLLEWLTVRILRLPILRPVNRGSQAAIADEAKRLQDLARDQIPAPRLLAVCERGLMMSDLGKGGETFTLDHLLHEAVKNGNDPFALWCAGTDALFALHEQGQYLSQAFARNILRLDDGTWAFIDFEEDPAHFLDIPSCQVRDGLLFLHATAHYFPNHDAAVRYWQYKLANAPENIANLFRTTVQRLAWVNRLGFIRYLGRDGRRLAQALNLLVAIASTDSSQEM